MGGEVHSVPANNPVVGGVDGGDIDVVGGDSEGNIYIGHYIGLALVLTSPECSVQLILELM